MLYVTCPVCDRSVNLDGIPQRLPVVVPEHANDDEGATARCDGVGRKSSAVWMVRPGAAAS
jgi:hypothetical protein